MAEIPTSDWTRINDAADRFERAWKDEPQPRIEDYLAEVDQDVRAALLEELLRVELELRRRDGEAIDPEEYSLRFSQHAALIEAVFGPEPDRPDPTGPQPDPTTAPVTADGQAHNNNEPPHGTRIRYFGDYEIQAELGRGGMGVVYKARQISLNRTVALKMIRSAALASDDEIRRFQNEAEAVARLDHTHIVPVYEVGEHDSRRYFSMKLIGGPSLQETLSSFAADPKAAAQLMVTVAKAVHHAHQRGILHRDLKPSNILLDEHGRPHVTDFGLAKRVEGGDIVTLSGAVVGTPAYMAPEQAWGKQRLVTTLSDVYGLGAVLYATLTGVAPFGGETALETLDRVRREPPVPPSRINPKVPRDLEVICLKCLEKDPARRYASAQALAEDLSRYVAGEPIAARPVGRLERAVKWARRRPAIAGLLGLVAIVSALGLGGVFWQWREATRTRSIALIRDRDAFEAQTKEREQTDLARQRLQALTARANEKEQTELTQLRIYDDRMNQVQRYWDDYNGALLQQGLNEQLPKNQGGIDRRGFEWFYWQRKMGSGHITLRGHTGGVLSVAFSPDGLCLASASSDHTVRVLDTETGEETLMLYEAKSETVASLAFSPDGSRLASAGSFGMLRVWDVATGQEILSFRGHDERANCVAFSPDGKRLASAGLDRTVKVWDAVTGQEICTLEGHTHEVKSVAFSPDGRRLASGSWDGTVKFWDPATGREILGFVGPIRPVVSLAFSLDGNRIASGGADGMLSVCDERPVWRTSTGKGHTKDIPGVALSADGLRLASASSDQTVKVWDINEVLLYSGWGHSDLLPGTLTFKGHTGPVICVAFSPDGRRLASGAWDHAVRVWDAVAGQESLTLKENGMNGVHSVAFSPDGHRLASASQDGAVRVWDAATGKVILAIRGRAGAFSSVAFSPDGRRLATGWEAAVRVWDALTGQELLKLEGHSDRVLSVAFSPDGHGLASGGRDNTVKVWDALTGHETLTLKGHIDPVNCVVFSPDGKRLASSAGGQDECDLRLMSSVKDVSGIPTAGDSLIIVAVVDDVLHFRIFGGNGKMVVNTDAKRLKRQALAIEVLRHQLGSLWPPHELTQREKHRVITSVTSIVEYRIITSVTSIAGHIRQDDAVRLWDTEKGQEILAIKGLTGSVKSVAFSPDGRRLASGSLDGTMNIWDTLTGQRTMILRGHADGVVNVSYSSDGKRLASAGLDRTVKVWDAVTGQEILTLNGHTDEVKSVAFSPDGRRLASGSWDGTVKVWDGRWTPSR